MAPARGYTEAVIGHEEGAVTQQARIEVEAEAAATLSSVRAMRVNGKDMTPVSTATGLRFNAMEYLAEGSNVLAVKAVFADGATRTLTHNRPPALAIAASLDRQTLGPANGTSPRDLTGDVERPVAVTGRASKPVVSVTINQQGAQLAAGGTEFSFPNFFLHEGINLLNVVAADANGCASTSSVKVTVDQTAPLLSVEAPARDAITSGSQVDVRGVVNDAVEDWSETPYPSVVVTNAANGQQRQIGSFAVSFPEMQVPLLQKQPPGEFTCPMVNGRLGACK